MKKNIKTYGITIISLLASFLICSLLLASLYQFGIIPTNIYSIGSQIMSYTCLIGCGVYLGLKTREKGLIHGLILAALYLVITLIIILISKNEMNLVHLILKPIVLLGGTIFGVNHKN